MCLCVHVWVHVCVCTKEGLDLFQRVFSLLFLPSLCISIKERKKGFMSTSAVWKLVNSIVFYRDYLLHNLQSNVSVSLIKVPDGVLQFIRKHFPKSSGFLFIFIRRESWHACVFDTIKWPCLTFQILMVKIIMLKSKRNNKRK